MVWTSVFQRTLPPAAAPATPADLIRGLSGIVNPTDYITRFRQSLATSFGKKYCFMFSSGKAALSVALSALRQLNPERSAVIIPAFNCYSVPSAIIHAGCTVIPCDSNPETLDFNETALKVIIQQRNDILAVIPTHLFGLPANIDRVRHLVKNPDVSIIEDAAQAMGTAYTGHPQLLTGDIVLFSLGRGKAYSAGEGGILLTNNKMVADAIQVIIPSLPEYPPVHLLKLIVQTMAMLALIHPRLFTIPAKLPFLKLGETEFSTDFPVRVLSGFQAGSALQWEYRLKNFNNTRLRCVTEYKEALAQTPGLHVYLQKETTVPSIRFPVLFNTEEIASEVLAQSKKKGLGIAATYPDAIDTIPEVQNPSYPPCIQARSITRRLLTLPCHQFVTELDIVVIVKVIKMVVENRVFYGG